MHSVVSKTVAHCRTSNVPSLFDVRLKVLQPPMDVSYNRSAAQDKGTVKYNMIKHASELVKRRASGDIPCRDDDDTIDMLTSEPR